MNYVPAKIYVQIPAPIIMGSRVRLWVQNYWVCVKIMLSCVLNLADLTTWVTLLTLKQC